jgi:hypothetical protein
MLLNPPICGGTSEANATQKSGELTVTATLGEQFAHLVQISGKLGLILLASLVQVRDMLGEVLLASVVIRRRERDREVLRVD